MAIRAKFTLGLLILISFVASFIFPGIGENEAIQNSITFIGILFGIIVGFFITDLYARYQGIRSNSAADSSALTTFWTFASILGQNKKNKKWLETVREAINSYVMKFMPLPWHRYSETEKEFTKLTNTLKTLSYDSDKENETYSNILAVANGHSDAREKLVMFGRDKLSWGEWLVVIFLGFLLLGSMFYIKDTSLVSSVFTGAITSSILILLFVLKDLNNLNFGENAVSIEPYERVFDAIGKPRYFKKNKGMMNVILGKDLRRNNPP